MDELKAWTCKQGHVLGQVKRNGRGIRQLLLYRNAVDLSAESPVEVDVMGYLEGTMEKIRCSCCGEVRTWEIGRETVEKVVEMYVAE